MTITPAYGRDYKSKKALLADWDANKDFVLHQIVGRGGYINKSDAKDLGPLQARYGKNMKVMMVNE